MIDYLSIKILILITYKADFFGTVLFITIAPFHKKWCYLDEFIWL